MNDWIGKGKQHVWGDRGIGERRDGMEGKQAKIKGQGKDGRKAWMWTEEGKDPTIPRNNYKACAFTCFGCAVAFAAATGLFISRRDVQAHLRFERRLDYPTQTCRNHPPGSVVLYRIIGNEIPGRHGPGQTLRNVPYILDQEENFQGCTKRFVLNRIVNDTVERELIQHFKERNVQFTRIPFEPRAYRKVLLDTGCLPTLDLLFHPKYHKLPARRKLRLLYAVYRLKNNYVLNNNGARNAALREGKSMAAWTLPWDGNCFLVPDAYRHIYSRMKMFGKGYLTVPMARLLALGDKELANVSSANFTEEAQIAFHCNSEMMFDEGFYYGHRAKAELLMRFAPREQWNKWKEDVGFGLRCPASKNRIPWHIVGRLDAPAGWVARLPSGNKALEVGENALTDRDHARVRGVLDFLFDIDSTLLGCKRDCTIGLDMGTLRKERKQFQKGHNPELVGLIAQLVQGAVMAQSRGPFSVVNQAVLPPSEDMHDYFCCNNGGNTLQDADDRAKILTTVPNKTLSPSRQLSLQSPMENKISLDRVLNDSTICALAWFFTGNLTFADHAVELLDVFFLNEKTRMNPHMKFARFSAAPGETGIMDMQGMYHFLDTVRLLQFSGSLSATRLNLLREWLDAYLTWLLESKPGRTERQRLDHRGIYFDIQVAAIAAFLKKKVVLMESLARAQSRLAFHFPKAPFSQNITFEKPQTHATTLNLLAWTNMAILSQKFGVPLWLVGDESSGSIVSGFRSLEKEMRVSQAGKTGRVDQVGFQVLRCFVADSYIPRAGRCLARKRYALPPYLGPDSNVRPFWNLGLSVPS